MCLRVIIADDEAIMRADLRERLELQGYHIVGEASDGFDAVELCREYRPDLVLLDIKMPMLDGIGAAKIINEEELAGCIMILSAYSDSKYVQSASDVGVMGYIVKPFHDSSLIPAIKVAVKRSREFKELKVELVEKDRKLEERKLIDKAKGIIMEKNMLTEREAYEYIRMMSMNKRKPMKTMAEIIILNDKYEKGKI